MPQDFEQDLFEGVEPLLLCLHCSFGIFIQDLFVFSFIINRCQSVEILLLWWVFSRDIRVLVGLGQYFRQIA